MSAAADLVRAIADPGSWQPWDGSLPGDETAPRYAAAGRESVVAGTVQVAGHPLALLLSDFGYLGGSVGVAAAAVLARGIERATRQGLPLLAMPASGGTRMQDGTPAFLRMADVVRLLTEHRAAGLPYLVYLRDPTAGGTFASWGSLGQLTFAEPGALVGFLGPRVHELLRPGALPRAAQRAENLAAHGVVDAVVPPGELRRVLADVLAVLSRPAPVPGPAPVTAAAPAPDAGAALAPWPGWDSVLRTRAAGRPGARELLGLIARPAVSLSGTGAGERDQAVLLALARVAGRPAVVVAHDRASGRLPGPGGLRTARRGIRLAAELRLPLLTVVDVAGAELSAAAEEGALAGEIARCLADLVSLPSPTVSVLLGEGGGGAALALLPADLTIAARAAWLAPLPPEGGSALVYRDLGHPAAIADGQHVTSAELLAAQAVDVVVDEPGGLAADYGPFLRRLGEAVAAGLAAVTADDQAGRLAARRSRLARIGLPR